MASYYGLTVGELTSPGRTRQLCAPRHLAMFLARERTAASLPEFLRRRLDEQQSREESLLLQLPMLEQASGR